MLLGSKGQQQPRFIETMMAVARWAPFCTSAGDEVACGSHRCFVVRMGCKSIRTCAFAIPSLFGEAPCVPIDAFPLRM